MPPEFHYNGLTAFVNVIEKCKKGGNVNYKGKKAKEKMEEKSACKETMIEKTFFRVKTSFTPFHPFPP